MGRKGKREVQEEGPYVNLWLIHVVKWQQYNIVKHTFCLVSSLSQRINFKGSMLTEAKSPKVNFDVIGCIHGLLPMCAWTKKYRFPSMDSIFHT